MKISQMLCNPHEPHECCSSISNSRVIDTRGGPLMISPEPAQVQSPHSSQQSPSARTQTKWTIEEDAKVIRLRNAGKKWEDVAKELPGRSDMACRLHFQNYLEKRYAWDDDLKNKLAYLYESFKKEMWTKIAEELGIPWKNAEAMHWQIGSQELAMRAGATPHQHLTGSPVEPQSQLRYVNRTMDVHQISPSHANHSACAISASSPLQHPEYDMQLMYQTTLGKNISSPTSVCNRPSECGSSSPLTSARKGKHRLRGSFAAAC